MNNPPFLTIITVTFNAERFLPRTLSSIENALRNLQDPSVVEYLIIDGASVDATWKTADQYSHIISQVISEKDQGLYDAMNKGIAASTGKYLWFLNAGDEIYDSNVLSNLLKKLEEEADIYYSDAMMVRENGTEIGLRSIITPHTLPKNLKWQDFSLGMKVCHQAFVAKKAIVPLYDIHNLSADIDWEITCLQSARQAKYLPFILCRYLVGGFSVQNHRRSLTDRFKVLSKHFGIIPTLFNHIRIIWRGFKFGMSKGKYW
ncbi:glycosyltransferase family 2 protein [Dyadobacter arcticus]|uniref:Glycosyltransferase involved in cell wall biosynthesis n=1 Tax=Dyadobacter arcticus TaxID=1078754 RepID=A0ABX0UGW9_9BACT|nr:glycosyltransferase family 2 protein [Dyadobacter arcticus]NIJ51748.1 glycosyltransferase involved in cell wall biosynthesis [Dyadobacter arcticus]